MNKSTATSTKAELEDIEAANVYLFDAEQHNPRDAARVLREPAGNEEFLKMASHGQVMLSMFRESFPKLPDGTVLLLDEPEMALSQSNQRRTLKMLMELVDQKKFRIIAATHSPVLLEAKETYVINLDKHINRNVIRADMGIRGREYAALIREFKNSKIRELKDSEWNRMTAHAVFIRK